MNVAPHGTLITKDTFTCLEYLCGLSAQRDQQPQNAEKERKMKGIERLLLMQGSLVSLFL